MEMVRDWVKKISALLGVAIQCSEYVKRMIVNRANYVRHRCRLAGRNGGGRQRALFLQHNWSFLVPYSQVTVPEGLNEKLKEQVTEEQDRLRASSDLIRCLQENTEGHSTLHRKRSAKHYSKRHQQRLKKIRTGSCAASLAWLENEGLTPVEVVVHDPLTKKLDTKPRLGCCISTQW